MQLELTDEFDVLIAERGENDARLRLLSRTTAGTLHGA
jgi:hypothetical protein